MKVSLIIILLALGWGAITGNFAGLNLLLGAAVGGLAVYLLRGSFEQPVVLRAGRLLALGWLFLRALVVSAVQVALVVLTPNLKAALKPAIIAFPLSVKSDVEITLLANLITLTPGTLSVDVSDDRQFLFVHVLTLATREALIAEIAGGFEARVRELFK